MVEVNQAYLPKPSLTVPSFAVMMRVKTQFPASPKQLRLLVLPKPIRGRNGRI